MLLNNCKDLNLNDIMIPFIFESIFNIIVVSLVEEYDSCPIQLKNWGFKEAHTEWNSFWMGECEKDLQPRDGTSREGSESQSPWAKICICVP